MISVEQGSYFSVKAKLLVLGGGQLHWLRYSRLEAMKVAKDGCVGAGRGSHGFFSNIFELYLTGNSLLFLDDEVEEASCYMNPHLLMYQRRELANLPVMGNAGASIHQGAGSRLHLGWQTGVLYVERAWLLHFNFTSDTATTISWFVNIAESRLQTSNH